MSAREKLEGLQFDDIKVIEYLGQKKYKVACTKCGKEKTMLSGNIKRGAGTKCDVGKVIDLTGQQIGDWKVLEYVGNKRYLCECQCEKHTKREVLKCNLLNGTSTGCGHNINHYGDLTGKRFGEWTVLRKQGYQWECKCSCSDTEIHLINASDLVSGKTKSCGHDYNKFEDISGRQYGLWNVLEYVGNQRYKCQCSCENKTIKLVTKTHLLSGYSTSCGCNKYNKSQQTLLEKYNERGPNKLEKPRTPEQINATSNKESLREFIKQHTNYSEYKIKPLELSQLLGIGLHRTLCLIHQFELEDYVDIRSFSSMSENEVLNFIKSIYDGDVTTRDRKELNGRELDIYIPEKKLAIEFNGNYWHSTIYKNRLYHQQKTLGCINKGIRLIHIFEYEWNNSTKQLKIKKMLFRAIRGSEPNERLYARNLEVKEIDKKLAYEFEDKHHLQGKANSSINIALTKDNEIIGIMTFDKPRFSKEYEYELIRLCWKDNITVIGGAEKLFKHFLKTYNPQSVVTYTDISKFTGQIYKRLGFKQLLITEPNYVWVNTQENEVLSRYQTQKHKLIEKGLGTPDQTEDEIMASLGYLKIHDSGNLKLEYRKENTDGNR